MSPDTRVGPFLYLAPFVSCFLFLFFFSFMYFEALLLGEDTQIYLGFSCLW